MPRPKIKRPIRHTVAQYPVIVQEDASGGYWVSCPAFQGCYSQGETIDQALMNIREAIQLCQEESSSRAEPRKPSDVSLHFVRV